MCIYTYINTHEKDEVDKLVSLEIYHTTYFSERLS